MQKAINIGCDICGERKELVDEHCHFTGKPRGFVCQRCNMLLGYIDKTPAIVESAREYADYWSTVHKFMNIEDIVLWRDKEFAYFYPSEILKGTEQKNRKEKKLAMDTPSSAPAPSEQTEDEDILTDEEWEEIKDHYL